MQKKRIKRYKVETIPQLVKLIEKSKQVCIKKTENGWEVASIVENV